MRPEDENRCDLEGTLIDDPTFIAEQPTAKGKPVPYIYFTIAINSNRDYPKAEAFAKIEGWGHVAESLMVSGIKKGARVNVIAKYVTPYSKEYRAPHGKFRMYKYRILKYQKSEGEMDEKDNG